MPVIWLDRENGTIIIIGQFFTTKKRLIQKTSNRKPTRAPTFYDVKHINVVA